MYDIAYIWNHINVRCYPYINILFCYILFPYVNYDSLCYQEENMIRDFNNATGAYASAGNPQGSINGIVCDVLNCYYNKSKSCVAGQIKVGPQNAITSGDTVCDTFRPQ